jgi:photosynthetic reaction center H subunit
MPTGAITGYIDVAQLTLYAFWIFFAGLIFYLRREDKREGYPLESERSSLVTVQGFPPLPTPKVFNLLDGHKVYAPRVEIPSALPLAGDAAADYLGAPMVPTGNAMIQGVGPASYVERADHPDMMYDEALPKLVPLRAAPGYWLAEEDPNPVGMTVIGADKVVAGICKDAWIDRSEMLVRYLEVGVTVGGIARDVLVPMTLVRINSDYGHVVVSSVLGAQFAEAPVLANPDQITLREEDRVSAYFAGGHMYATPARQEPLI